MTNMHSLKPNVQIRTFQTENLTRRKCDGLDFLVGFKYHALWHIQNRLKHIRLAIKNREKQGIFAKNGHFD